MKDNTIYIGVEIAFMLACIVFGVSLWGNLLGAFNWLVELGHPYLWSAGFMFIINLGHYLWGFFHTDDDFSDIPTRGMMTSYFDYQRIGIRIMALLTIGPSQHLRRAIELAQADVDEAE